MSGPGISADTTGTCADPSTSGIIDRDSQEVFESIFSYLIDHDDEESDLPLAQSRQRHLDDDDSEDEHEY